MRLAVKSNSYDVKCDAARHYRAKIGDVLPGSEQTIKDEVGHPVVCSNQAMIRDTLRPAGVDDCLSVLGKLRVGH